MASFGETACVVGSAAALQARDLVYTQYREQGAHIWRGFTIEQVINQCMGNVNDIGKGRQMPVHYGSKQLNNVTVSSPLSKLSLIQPLKFLKLLDLVISIALPMKIRQLLATLGKVQQAREIFQLLLTLPQLSAVKPFFSAVTINLPFLLQQVISMFPMVLSHAPFHLASPALESMATMLSQYLRLLERQGLILLSIANPTLSSS